MFNKGKYYKPLFINFSFNEMRDMLDRDPNYVAYLGYSYFTKDQINDKNAKFTIEQFTSNEWQILDIDWDLTNKRDEIQDYLEDELDIDFDSRFYDPDLMSIHDMWNYLDDYCRKILNENTYYDIFMYLKENNKLNKNEE